MRVEPLAVKPDQFAAVIEDLRFKFHKWDAYVNGSLAVLSEALMLTPAEHRDAVDCCIRVHRALERAAARVLEEPCLLDRLAIPKAVQPLIRAEMAHPYHIARYDLIPTAAGWMIPEFNEDAPGGFNESIAANALFAGLLSCGTIPGDFAQSFESALPPGERVGIVYATGYAEDLQHMLILADLLRARGIETVLASPDHLACGYFGKPRLLSVPVDWILRFFPGEWYVYLDNLQAWQRAVARVPVVNPLSRLVRQSKALYALWREESLLDETDAGPLNRCTPYTEFFRKDRAPEYTATREEWVLKKPFGRMGDNVTIGRLCKAEDWAKAVAEAATKPEAFIAQRAFVPLPAPNGTRMLYPALGVYLINGAFAGYYSRADETGFITNEAYYVVTAVETA